MRKSSTRGAQGGGSLRKKVVVRNGKEYTYWEGRVTIGKNPGDGRQIQRSFTGKTQKEVLAKMQQAQVELNTGAYLDPSRMTVGQWLDIWARDYLVNAKPLTVVNHEGNIRNHIAPALGALRLETLSSHCVQEFYNALAEGSGSKPGLSPATVRNVHSTFHTALQQALRNGYIRSNPTDNCVLPRVQRKEIKPLDSDDISAFLKAIRGHRFEDLYTVLLFTGLRRSEALGLLWSNVSLENATICIDRQLQIVPGQLGEFRLVPTKNGRNRTITVAASVVDVLKRHKVEQAEARLLAGPEWEDGNFVFCDERGHHLSPNTVYHQYKRIVASIGVPSARLHDLRHSYAVASLQAGDNVKVVQQNLGHSSARVTLDTYCHVTQQMQQESAQRMERFIQDVSNL